MIPAEQARLHRQLVLQLFAEARERFYAFVLLMAQEVLPEQFVDGAHIKVICDKLQKVYEGEVTHLQIWLPPGSMKSVLCMLFEAWCLGKSPMWRIIGVSHTKTLAHVFGGKVRDLLVTDTYQAIFPATHVTQDSRAKALWATTHGGGYFAAGSGTAIAGFRANLAVLDDVLSEQTASSDLEREKINMWYTERSRK